MIISLVDLKNYHASPLVVSKIGFRKSALEIFDLGELGNESDKDWAGS